MATTAALSLPLHCSVCPKKPSFSDVSHLLTHIASKGHLSHYYKLKVRSSQDQLARDSIDNYDDWYNVWGIEDLMSTRLQDKEKKRPRTRAQASAPRPSAKKLKKEIITQVVDPFLPALPHATEAVMSKGTTPDNALSLPLPNRPQMFLWSTRRPTSYMAIPVESSSPSPFEQNFGSSQNDTIADADEEDSTIVDEAARLKGVYWPGMDIFDSATADMRRMRNQKKATSVLKHLEQNSLVVEATEVIYYSLGDLKKERKITGKVESSSSPLSDLLPLPTKRKAPVKKPLQERSVNTSIDQPSGRAARNAPAKNRTNARQATSRPKRTFAVHNDGEPRFDPDAGMQLLTAGFRPATKGRAFDLFLPSLEAGLGMHHGGVRPQENTHRTYAPYDSSQVAAKPEFFGPGGYDLAAFLSHSLQRESRQQSETNDSRSEFSFVANPGYGVNDGGHDVKDGGLEMYSPFVSPVMQHESPLDFDDDDEFEYALPLNKGDKSALEDAA